MSRGFSSHPGLLAACRAEVVVPIAIALAFAAGRRINHRAGHGRMQVPFRSLSGSLPEQNAYLLSRQRFRKFVEASKNCLP
jgi:hypothetical protein